MPIVVKEDGNSMLFKEVQFRKLFVPIVVSVSGKSMVSSAVRSVKRASPISVMPSRNTRDVIWSRSSYHGTFVPSFSITSGEFNSQNAIIERVKNRRIRRNRRKWNCWLWQFRKRQVYLRLFQKFHVPFLLIAEKHHALNLFRGMVLFLILQLQVLLLFSLQCTGTNYHYSTSSSHASCQYNHYMIPFGISGLWKRSVIRCCGSCRGCFCCISAGFC